MASTPKKYELIDAACAFWFGEDERVRSPFPEAIRPDHIIDDFSELEAILRDSYSALPPA